MLSSISQGLLPLTLSRYIIVLRFKCRRLDNSCDFLWSSKSVRQGSQIIPANLGSDRSNRWTDFTRWNRRDFVVDLQLISVEVRLPPGHPRVSPTQCLSSIEKRRQTYLLKMLLCTKSSYSTLLPRRGAAEWCADVASIWRTRLGPWCLLAAQSV